MISIASEDYTLTRIKSNYTLSRIKQTNTTTSMQHIFDLNEENFELTTIKLYGGTSWSKEDFEDDMKRLKYIKRLIGKYLRTGDLKERLILNHIIILGNVFGPAFTSKLLFFRLEKKYYPIVKTFLLYLNYLPDTIATINGNELTTRDIPIDMHVADLLRKI